MHLDWTRLVQIRTRQRNFIKLLWVGGWDAKKSEGYLEEMEHHAEHK